jgi:uncharacterized membrane protein YagU involved in acid resistance
MGRTIALATLVAGTLDIVFAMILTLIFGREIPDMLRRVASGPFPAATDMGISGAVLGLVVHFTLMAVMAAVYVLFASAPARRHLIDMPYRAGLAYGVITYIVMNLIVVPLRFGTWPPKPLSVATQLFAHIVLVGIPIALITARSLRPRQS